MKPVKNEDVSQLTDEELVKLSLRDERYYAYLIERYEDKLMRYIMRISASTREDAEDVLQDVFISAYRNLNSFDTKLKFSSWIYRITHNKVISAYRKKTSRPSTVTYEGDKDILNMFSSEEDIEEDIIRKSDSKEVLRILSKLDIKYREALILKFLEDKSYAEISDILEKPIGTVATLINRAKKQFKEKLKKQKSNL